MKADQVQPRSGHPRSQPLHELQRRRPLVRRAVVPGGLELQHHLTRSVGLHALGGRVRIDTAPDKGTTIAVDIPLKRKEYERLG